MKSIAFYISALCVSAGLLAGCQKFTEPDPIPLETLESNMTLADFKAMYHGTPVEITDANIILEGKVISSDRSGNVYRSLYIEDGTAGLEVKIGRTGMYNDYSLGQTVYIRPQSLYLGAYGESVQLGAVSTEEKYETSYIDVQALINRTVIRGAKGDPLPPTDITASSQISDAMVCRFVRLMNVSYQGSSDGINTWAISANAAADGEAAYGQHTFTLENREVVVRTSGYASFADDTVGLDLGEKCNLTGILTKFYDTWQMVLLDLDGVERLSAATE